MKISLIAAVAQNGIIGRDNDLPWHLPDDFAFFKSKITNHVVIMGRKSLEANAEPLPSLTNIVITQNKNFKAVNVKIVHTMEDAIGEAVKVEKDEIFVIGGAQVYSMAMPIATTLYLTEIKKAYAGDTFFPAFNRSEWKEVVRVSHPADNKHETAFDFVTYERT